MDFDTFREQVRVGIVAGVFTVGQVIAYLICNNWQTTRDVPDDRREKLLRDLTK